MKVLLKPATGEVDEVGAGIRGSFTTVPAVDGATEGASRGSRDPQIAGGE